MITLNTKFDGKQTLWFVFEDEIYYSDDYRIIIDYWNQGEQLIEKYHFNNFPTEPYSINNVFGSLEDLQEHLKNTNGNIKLTHPITQKVTEIETFVLNDKIIWDSGFGYEVGYFRGEGTQYNTWLVGGGSFEREVSHSKGEISKHNIFKHKLLTNKYGYKKNY